VPAPKEEITMIDTLTSAEATRRSTGRDREDWFALLDAWGATGRRHGEIVQWLMREHGVTSWWAQTLTVEYERARGLRKPGGGRDGRYTISVTRTVAAPVARLFAAFTDPAVRKRWLAGDPLRERTSQPGRSARFDYRDDGTRVVVGFEDKGGRSQVAVVHERLANPAAAATAKAYWQERLTALKTMLEKGEFDG
jgi:hypothetical protein